MNFIRQSIGAEGEFRLNDDIGHFCRQALFSPGHGLRRTAVIPCRSAYSLSEHCLAKHSLSEYFLSKHDTSGTGEGLSPDNWIRRAWMHRQ